jgi:hypothetical protein
LEKSASKKPFRTNGLAGVCAGIIYAKEGLFDMKYFIELSRSQHTTVSVDASSLDEAFDMARGQYYFGDIAEDSWYDYDDSPEMIDATEYNGGKQM